jgi:galactose mutarotase-like enzyme
VWIRATGLDKRWVEKKAVEATTRVDDGKEGYPMNYIKPVVFGIHTYFSQVDA